MNMHAVSQSIPMRYSIDNILGLGFRLPNTDGTMNILDETHGKILTPTGSDTADLYHAGSPLKCDILTGPLHGFKGQFIMRLLYLSCTIIAVSPVTVSFRHYNL